MDKFRCADACKPEPTDHTFIEEFGDYNEFYKIECNECKTRQSVGRHEWLSFQVRNEVRSRQAYLTKWPRWEPQSGLWVTSKDHEKESLKRAGYHEAKHGIDERYNGAEKDWSRDRRSERN